MLKIRRSHDHIIFSMGIHIPGKDGLYIEMGLRCYVLEAKGLPGLNPSTSRGVSKAPQIGEEQRYPTNKLPFLFVYEKVEQPPNYFITLYCLGHSWFGSLFIACLVTSHYLDQCLLIVNWTAKNKLQQNFNQNTDVQRGKYIWNYHWQNDDTLILITFRAVAKGQFDNG